jgi:predicted AlkP superfamily pyrophosphatase or phosphodiesterase
MLHAMRYRDTRENNNETRYALEGVYRYTQDHNEAFFHIIHQSGNNQGERISAWFSQLKLSHYIADFTVAGTASYASSDDAGHDDLEIKGFKPLFAKAPYYSEAGIFATTNIKHIGVDLQYVWSPKLTLHSAFKRLYRVNQQGNIYGPGHSLMISADQTTGSLLADTVDLSIEYKISKNFSIELVSSYVSPANQLNLSTTTFFESMLHYAY